jgi:hypothetical protein
MTVFQDMNVKSTFVNNKHVLQVARDIITRTFYVNSHIYVGRLFLFCF